MPLNSHVRYVDSEARRWTSLQVTKQLQTLVVTVDHRWSEHEIAQTLDFKNHLSWDQGAKRRLRDLVNEVFGTNLSASAVIGAKTVADVQSLIEKALMAQSRMVAANG
jgi:hypothetical protein